MTVHHSPQSSSIVDPATVREWLLRGLVFSLLLGGVLGGTAALIHYLRARPEPSPVGQVRIPADELPRPGDPPLYRADCRCFLVYLRAGEGSEGRPPYRGMIQMQPAREPGIVVVSEQLPGHCPVRWWTNGPVVDLTNVLRDPCHGGTYTRVGFRIFGPGVDYLSTFPASIERNGTLVILTRQAQKGGPDNTLRIDRPAPQFGIFPAR